MRLEIAALELEGFPPARAPAIAAACEAELTRILAGDPSLLARLGNAPAIECAPIRVDPLALPQSVGAAIAHAIVGGLR